MLSNSSLRDEGNEEPGIQNTSLKDEIEIASALLMIGGVAENTLVCRTQRRVCEQVTVAMERRSDSRRGMGLAILGFSLLLLVLTPVLWGGFHLIMDGDIQDFMCFEMQSIYLLGWLFPATLAGVVLGCMRVRAARGTRPIDHEIGVQRLGTMVR